MSVVRFVGALVLGLVGAVALVAVSLWHLMASAWKDEYHE